MAERDPNVPQVEDPETAADLIRLLRIVGPLGRLSVSDVVVPVVNMGDVVTRFVTVVEPGFRATDIFSNGFILNAATNAILADTGALPAGTYDIQLQMSSNADEASTGFMVQLRNAANSATVVEWPYAMRGGILNTIIADMTVALEIGANERLRILNIIVGAGIDRVAAAIFARIR